MSDENDETEDAPNVEASELPDEGGVEAELEDGEDDEEDSESTD